MKTIFFLRHAESVENEKIDDLVSSFQELNLSKLKNGLSYFCLPSMIDTELSDRGKHQVEQLRDRLYENDFLHKNRVDLILHSPLKRSIVTCFEGVVASNEDHSCIIREEKLIHEKHWYEFIFSDIHNRIRSFERFLSKREETTILIVGHSRFFQAMFPSFIKLVSHCDIYSVQFDEVNMQWTLPLLML